MTLMAQTSTNFRDAGQRERLGIFPVRSQRGTLGPHRAASTWSSSLQDISGEIRAKVFQDVDTLKLEFDAGEFVKAQGRSNLYQGRTEIILDKIRRVMPDRDAADGFREEDCIRCAPRPVDEMWAELMGRLDSVSDPALRALLHAIVDAARRTSCASGRPRARFIMRTAAACSNTSSRSWKCRCSSPISTAPGAIC